MLVAVYMGKGPPVPAYSVEEALAIIRRHVVRTSPGSVKLVDGRLHRKRQLRGGDVFWEPIFQEIWVQAGRAQRKDLSGSSIAIVADHHGIKAHEGARSTFTEVHHYEALVRVLNQAERGLGRRAPRLLAWPFPSRPGLICRT